MEFTLRDRDEHTTRVIINGGTVQFSERIPEVGPARILSEVTYSAACLLDLIEDMSTTPGFAFLQIALYGNTQVAIRLHESQKDVVELHVGAVLEEGLEEGAGLRIPISVIRAVLGGVESAPEC